MPNDGSLKVETPTPNEIVLTRTFDAPWRMVYDAFTRPELVKRWFGAKRGTLVTCEIDLRVGGAYRYVWRHLKDGAEMGMGGVYREIAAPERLVATEKFDEAWYPGEALLTLELVERAGRTFLTQTMRYESREAREAVLKSPMEEGLVMSFDRLEALLTSAPGGAA